MKQNIYKVKNKIHSQTQDKHKKKILQFFNTCWVLANKRMKDKLEDQATANADSIPGFVDQL